MAPATVPFRALPAMPVTQGGSDAACSRMLVGHTLLLPVPSCIPRPKKLETRPPFLQVIPVNRLCNPHDASLLERKSNFHILWFPLIDSTVHLTHTHTRPHSCSLSWETKRPERFVLAPGLMAPKVTLLEWFVVWPSVITAASRYEGFARHSTISGYRAYPGLMAPKFP